MLNVHRSHIRFVRDGEREREREMLNVHRSHIRFVRDGWRYLQRPKRPSATARTINVKEVRNRAKQLQVLRDLFFFNSCAERQT